MRPSPTELPWHQRMGYTVLLLILMCPVGLVLMWRNGFWSLRTRRIITVVGLLFFMMQMNSLGHENDESNKPTMQAPLAAGSAASTSEAEAGSGAVAEAPDPAVPKAAASPAPLTKPLTRAEVQAVVKDMERLLQQGRAMASLRDPPDDDPARLDKLRSCGTQMRERQARVRQIRQQTASLPDSVLYVGIAATHLELCVSCAKSQADENCHDAAEALREAKAQLVTAHW